MSGLELVDTIPVENVLGECVLWDERSACLWWTDIHASMLYRYSPGESTLERFELPERLCSFGLVESGRRLICAFETGFAFYAPGEGDPEWLFRPELDFQGTRFNDGRVDREGRFWSGTMVEGEALDPTGEPAAGSLYWIAGARHGRALGGIAISNSLCFSPDGATLYFTDSPTRRILAFDLDAASGTLGASRVFAEVAGVGAPDGSIVDAEGFLWNAQWGGSKLVRYAPSGKPDFEQTLPVTQPTCLCFGGEALDWLFVTTASEGLAESSLSAEPEAGNVLIYRTGFKGLPESRYRP